MCGEPLGSSVDTGPCACACINRVPRQFFFAAEASLSVCLLLSRLKLGSQNFFGLLFRPILESPDLSLGAGR